MDLRYHIEGGHPLQGNVCIGGSKNASLPLIAASLLCEGDTVLSNVPRIRDIESMLTILEFLGAQVQWEGEILRIRTDHVRSRAIPSELVSKFRAAILFLGPLLSRFGIVEMAYPGGCVIGKRPVDVHLLALAQLGAANSSTDEILHLQGKLRPGRVILSEFSVTATENVLLACSLLPGETRIELAACEPHVQDLCVFLSEGGTEMGGIGSHTLTIHGQKGLHAHPHRVIPDDLEAGFFIAAALAAKGDIVLEGVCEDHLLFFLQTVRQAGGVLAYEENERYLRVRGDVSRLKGTTVQSNIFPGLQTDLLPPLGVALTQAQGVSRLFERLYERRMAYLYELEKMGAHVEFLNAHQALIIGPTPLRGLSVASNDIRAGAAMVIAGLCAEGETVIHDIQYIERGYDRLEEKLRGLGARITRVEGGSQERESVKEALRHVRIPTFMPHS